MAFDSADEGPLRALRRLADSPPDVSHRFAQASSEAVSEVWAVATLALHRAEPFWHERFRMPRGRTLAGEPQERAGTERYLLDERQRVLAIEEFEAPSGHRLVEVFDHDPDRICSVQWCEDDLEAVREARLERGQITSLAAIEWNGEAWLERYERDREGRVAVIWEPENRWPPDGVGFRDHGGPLKVDYDELGRLLRITALETDEIIYRTPPEPIEALLTRTVLHLADEVRAQFAACRLPGPVSSVQFVYGDPSAWIPVAHYETKASRDERLAHPAGAVPTSLLPQPSEVADHEVPHLRGVDSGWTDDVDPWLEQELPLAGLNEPAAEVLARLARHLNETWTPPFETTDDFVVFCADHEGYEMEQHIRPSVPTPLLSRLARDPHWRQDQQQ